MAAGRIFASAGMPHESHLLLYSKKIVYLVQFATASDTSLILSGAASSHHLVLGSTDFNPRGEALLAYISSTNGGRT